MKKKTQKRLPKGTQSMSLSNPYQNVPVQSNNFNFPGAV